MRFKSKHYNTMDKELNKKIDLEYIPIDYSFRNSLALTCLNLFVYYNVSILSSYL